MRDPDYAFFVNKLPQAKSKLQGLEAGGIIFYVNANKTEFMRLK